MTSAEIASGELIQIQEVKVTWPGSLNNETGESSDKVERNAIYDLQGLM